MDPNLCPAGVAATLSQFSENARIQEVEKKLLGLPQVECPLQHRFSDGCYLRTIWMPAGNIVIGHQHKTRHFNIVTRGKVMVMMDGVLERIEAPAIFESGPGVRKVLYIAEDTEWSTLHVTPERDLAKLEEILIVKSDAFMDHQLKEDAEKLRLAAESLKNADA